MNVNVLDTFSMSTLFHNQGTVNVAQGTLTMDDGGIHTGKFSYCSTCIINFSGGTHQLAEESIVPDGTGIKFSGGTTTISGTFEANTFQQLGGTTTFTKLYTSNGTIEIAGGTLDFKGSAVLANVVLSGSASKLFANLENSQVDVTNSFRWQGISCVVGENGNGQFNLLPTCRTTISGTGRINAPVTNYGQTDYFPSSGMYINSGPWTNAPNSFFNVSSSGSLVLSGSLFVHQGFMSVAVPTSKTFTFNCPLDNAGTIEVRSGTLAMNSDGERSGTFTHGYDTFIRFEGGTHMLTPTSVINAGTGIGFSGAAVTIQGKFYPEFFHQNGGTVAFDNGADHLAFCSISQTSGTLTFQQSIGQLPSRSLFPLVAPPISTPTPASIL